jgi:hypothetical protein
MDTMFTRLGKKEQGHTMSWPTWPKDPGQEIHNRGDLKIIIR